MPRELAQSRRPHPPSRTQEGRAGLEQGQAVEVKTIMRPSSYRLPDPLLSSDGARRLAGDDIASMTDRELYAEGVRAAAALADAIASDSRVWLLWNTPPYSIHVADWLERRLAQVQAETRRRKGVRM